MRQERSSLIFPDKELLAGLKSNSFFMKDRLTEAQVKRKDGSKVEEKKQSFQEESVILLSFIEQENQSIGHSFKRLTLKLGIKEHSWIGDYNLDHTGSKDSWLAQPQPQKKGISGQRSSLDVGRGRLPELTTKTWYNRNWA